MRATFLFVNKLLTVFVATSYLVNKAMCFSIDPGHTSGGNLQMDTPQEPDQEKMAGRRKLLLGALAVASTCTSKPVYAVERAVGSSERVCREKGNCLENFELDGAIGWNWGGRDRCDA